MDKILIKELMIPLAEYPSVDHSANLYDAIIAMEEAHAKFTRSDYKPRAVLVKDDAGLVVGKLSMWNIVRALEPKYDKIADFDRLTHWGLNPDFIRSIVKSHGLWADPVENLCQSAAQVLVKDIMYTPGIDEMVDEDDTLSEAIHHLVIGRYLSLLVNKKGKVTGILRLCDVFEKIGVLVKSCGI